MKTKTILVLMLVIFMLGVTTEILAAGEKEKPVAEEKVQLIIGVADLPPNVDNELMSHPLLTNYFILSCLEGQLEYGDKPSSMAEGVKIMNHDKSIPRLAESFEISSDSKTITFHLRKGVKSPWGNEFTADDVLWKWQRGFAMHGLSEWYASIMDFGGVESIEKVDDYTIRMTAERPNALLRKVNSNSCVTYYDSTEAKKHITDANPWAQDFIGKQCPGFGPYYITEWTPGNQAVLEINPNYYREKPKIKKIIFKVIPESSSRVAMLKAGTIDIALELSPREVDSLRDAPGVRVIEETGIWFTHLIMHENLVEPFSDKRVRQAVNYAINRKKLVDTAYFGLAEPMQGCIEMHYTGALDKKDFPYSFDLEKAKELMVAAGYQNGFEVELMYRAGIPHHETTAVMVKEDLAKIGINVKLKKTPVGAFETTVRASEATFALYIDAPWDPDINYCCALFFASKGFINYGKYNNPNVDSMLQEGETIIELKKRLDHHLKLQKIIVEDAPIVWLVQEKYMVAMRDYIKGWNITIGDGTKLDEVYIGK